MLTCCTAHPTSRPHCPSCSPSTSKLCCAFSPLPWLLTSKPWPGRGSLKLSQGKLLGCRGTKFSNSQNFVHMLGCSSSVPLQHPDRDSWKELSFPGCVCLLSVHPCPQHTPSQCSIQGALQSYEHGWVWTEQVPPPLRNTFSALG